MTQADLFAFLQSIYTLNNPTAVLASYSFMGLAAVTNLVPLQHANLPAGPAYFLEFDGFLRNGLPISAVDAFIEGAADGVEVFISGRPDVMDEIAQLCFQLLIGIELTAAHETEAAPAGSGVVSGLQTTTPAYGSPPPVDWVAAQGASSFATPVPATKSPEGRAQLLKKVNEYVGLKWASDMADLTWRK